LQEKLAAARANAATAPSAGGAKPAATKTAAAAVAKTATKRELPPLDKITDPKDLAEALRQTGAKKDQDLAAAKAKEAPVKPAKEKEKKPESVLPRPAKGAVQSAAGETATLQTRRRGFLLSATAIIWIAWGAFLFGLTAFTAMLGRFMFPNVLAEPPSTIKIGLPTTYDPEAVNERFKAEWGFWIVRSTRVDGQDIIYALQSVCTHLGCPPNWLSGEQKFKCPCHGSGFYISGINFEGPAPRPLERFKVTLADDGQIIVDKSQKFQQELGQWSDPDSFITA
jgi:cytochrome b6-f complex iron-sulfur subunit